MTYLDPRTVTMKEPWSFPLTIAQIQTLPTSALRDLVKKTRLDSNKEPARIELLKRKGNK